MALCGASRALKGLLMAVTVAAGIAAGPAFGHAKLLGTLPPADAQLQAAPKSLILTFNENVRLAVLPAAPQVSVALPLLTPGEYQVQWSALSPDDGHVTKGTFSFVIVGY